MDKRDTLKTTIVFATYKKTMSRWMREAKTHDLSLTQWIRRNLNLAYKLLFLEPIYDEQTIPAHQKYLIKLSVPLSDKQRWTQLAQSEGLTLKAWIINRLNACLSITNPLAKTAIALADKAKKTMTVITFATSKAFKRRCVQASQMQQLSLSDWIIRTLNADFMLTKIDTIPSHNDIPKDERYFVKLTVPMYDKNRWIRAAIDDGLRLRPWIVNKLNAVLLVNGAALDK